MDLQLNKFTVGSDTDSAIYRGTCTHKHTMRLLRLATQVDPFEIVHGTSGKAGQEDNSRSLNVVKWKPSTTEIVYHQDPAYILNLIVSRTAMTEIGHATY